MIQTIVELFNEASTKHKEVNGFTYSYPSKVLGNGEDRYPHVYLEEPLSFGTSYVTDGAIDVTISFDVLVKDRKQKKHINQNRAEKIGLEMIAYINDNDLVYTKISRFSMLSLSRFTDDSVEGVRFTVHMTVANDYTECVEDKFDPNKTFDDDSVLPDVDTDEAEGCESNFYPSLPNIEIG